MPADRPPRSGSGRGPRSPPGSAHREEACSTSSTSPDGDDPTVRPNQLLAYSLPHAPLDDAGATSALAASLLTPLGLRSLAPDAPGYRGRHRGGPAQRDGAYHQGTVRPWLIGPWTDARLRAGAPRSGDQLDGAGHHLPLRPARWDRKGS